MSENKSCVSCRFFVAGADAGVQRSGVVAARVDAWGSPAAGGSVCARFGSLLAVGGSMDARVAESIGAACAAFESVGDSRVPPMDPVMVHVGPLVAAPVQVESSDEELSPIVGCFGCERFVPSGVVGDVGGVECGFCSGTSRLVPVSRASGEGCAASVCGVAVSGSVEADQARVVWDSVSLFDHVRAGLRGDEVKSAKSATEPEGEAADGADVPAASLGSIQAVAQCFGADIADLEKLGVVASFRLESDDGSRHVDLPVFDSESFDAVERAKIPVAGDDSSPELFTDFANVGYRVAAAWVLGETPALTGAPGLGKSAAAYWLAWKMNVPLERVSVTKASSLDDLAGYVELVREGESSTTQFIHGRVPQAWGKRCVLLLDEPNAGPAEVWQFLRPLTDSAKQLIVDANHGERVDRHRFSFLMMAMNPAWDYRNSGVAPLSDADGRRLVHVTVPSPGPKVEREIIVSHVEAAGQSVDGQVLDRVVAIGQALRNLAGAESGSGALQITWGLAQQVKVAKLLRFFSLADAYRLAGADSVDPQQRELILGEVNRLSGTATSTRRGSSGGRRGGRRA